MNFARHLLRRTADALVKPIIRPIILPSVAPLRVTSTPIPRIPQILPRLQPQKRHKSTAIGSLTNDPKVAPDPANEAKEVKPSYDLTFTCRPCGHRSTHNVSKQGYHYGSTLIKCPGCHNRHVISDHLKIFGETSRSFEEILDQAGHGQKVGKYSLGERGYEEIAEAEDILRTRGVWSENGDVEILPEDGIARPTEESWEKGLDAGGRNVYPDPEEQPEVESTREVNGAKVVDDGAVEGVGRKKDL